MKLARTTTSCLAAFALTGTSVLAQDYDIHQLPMVAGWDNMFPFAINDNGHVVGIDTEGFWSMPRGFYYDGETAYEFAQDWLETLPYPSWQLGVRPLRINNNNHILFTLEILDVGGFSYVWDGENFTEVQPDVPGSAGAGAINNLGVLAGTYNYITPDWNLINRGWVYDPSTDQTIVIEPVEPFEHSVATDISDTGYVVGHVFGGPVVATGFVWKDGVMTLVEGVDEDDYLSIAQRVNNDGFVAGFTTNFPPPGSPSLSRVFFWNSDGQPLDWAYPIGAPNSIQTYGLNENNEIVGTMTGPQQPFHFHNGVMRNLNDHFEQPVPGWTLDLWDAYGVNNHGQIVSHGPYLGSGSWFHHSFILTPKPSCAPADLDCSGSVGVPDLLILLGSWGVCADCGNCPADLNGDCSVGVPDLLLLLSNWG